VKSLLAVTAATTTREVKASKMPVGFGSLGLFLGVSASNSTGASHWFTAAHDHYRIDHFEPLLSTSYA
jgi:hypothetical protein